MQFLLGLDYELFFGRSVGTPEACLLRPTAALFELGRTTGLRVSLFVDAGYLVSLRKQAERHRALGETYSRVARQLREAVRLGHDVQLHVHPHWEDSIYDGERWLMNTRRYRLHDFTPGDIATIVSSYKDVLANACGVDVFAYRAGGWCLQPFRPLQDPLRQAGIWLDSTVFAGGYKAHDRHGFDYRGAVHRPHWRFEHDPLEAVDDGYFVEVPITSIATGPGMYWKMAMLKLRGGESLKPFGDGSPIAQGRSYYLRRLFGVTTGPASVDGIKAGYLKREARRIRSSLNVFNVMGHPKSITSYSLTKLGELLRDRWIEPRTFRDFVHLAPRARTTEST